MRWLRCFFLKIILIFFVFMFFIRFVEGAVILVDKGERSLKIFVNGQLKEAYEIGLGLDSLVPKERKGDFLTPEGIYSVIDIRPSHNYFYFIEINYPNLNDLGLAYYKGNLSKEEFEKLLGEFTKENYVKVNFLGGQIGIHGGGAYKIERGKKNYHWTQGCIALKDKDLKKIFPVFYVGQKVIIVNSKKNLYEILKKLVYPTKIKPFEIFEGELYLRLNEEEFVVFHLKEYYQKKKFLTIREYNKGELVNIWESDELGMVKDEERFKRMILEKGFNLIKPYKTLEF